MSGDVPALSVADTIAAVAAETRAALSAVPPEDPIGVALRRCVRLTSRYLQQRSVSTTEAGFLVALLEEAIAQAHDRNAIQLEALIDGPRARMTLLRYGPLECRLVFGVPLPMGAGDQAPTPNTTSQEMPKKQWQ